ncbi:MULTISPECIES: hypothetical protein [unclassified Duganella]|uniref:hypothetical protein n=1 Tax=unclassified Duganella TaxID=2636909 RepID=UPI000880DDBA|nr:MULTISPECIES: hypothetical protein [unclassified Duganella]SDF58591.1 hypothetical protein SAMN05216320_101649 [Duganella sp. OV458]SDI70005.1 hypothetical protein SAMN05428973_101766 [Duganella sp. OV510]
MQEETVLLETVDPAICGNFDIVARGNVTVYVEWRFAELGASVSVDIRDDKGNSESTFTLRLGKHRIVQLGVIDVTLSADAGDEHAVPGIYLRCCLPLSSAEFFDAVIGGWYSDDPGPPPFPPPPPFYPPRDETAAQAYRIDALPAAADLFPFIWLHAPDPHLQQEMVVSFASCSGFADFALYKNLQRCVGADAAAQKRQVATAFLKGADSVKLDNLAEKLSLTQAFSLLRVELEALPPQPSIDVLEQVVEAQLQMTVNAFLDASDWRNIQNPCLWQTLYALALSGDASDAALSAALYPLAQTAYWLGLLADGTLAATTPALRLRPLSATLSMPDLVAARMLTLPTFVQPAPLAPAGRWELLGMGTLKMARQRLQAYVPGELAEVVNVMPRERQEVQERQVVQDVLHERQLGEQTGLSEEQQHTAAASELGDAMQAVMAADGLLRDMNNVHPSYANLDLTLSGSAAGGDARSGWGARQAAQLAQRVTEQAATRLGQRVGWQRKRIWQQLQERRQSNLIDNAGNGRLVGVYRWIDRLLQVHMENLGQRLVLSFLFEQPAQDWLAQVKAEHGISAAPPVAPLTFGATDGKGYQQITEINYQDFGAFYGLDELEAPPPATLRLCASFDRASAASGAALNVPDGYLGVSGEVTAALSDSRYNLAGVVAGVSVTVAASTLPLALSVTVPQASAPAADVAALPGQDSASGAAAVSVSVPAPSQSAFGKTDISSAVQGRAGAIPLTLISSAPAFVVNIEVLCQRDPAAGGSGARAMKAWQIRIYQRLQQADQASQRAYADAVAAAVAAASAGRGGDVQRDALRQRCLALLAPAAPQEWRVLSPALDWQAMAWQYEEWPVAAPPAWPEPAPAAATEPGADRLFRQFLRAPAARVLLTVLPGSEIPLLYALQFGRSWPGGIQATPVTDSCRQLVEQLRRSQVLTSQTPPWSVRLPTSMLYLQESDHLPSFIGPPPAGLAPSLGMAP